MKQLNWTGDNDFLLEGVRFHCVQGTYSQRSTEDQLILLKDRIILEKYAAEFATDAVKNVLEFGIFQGGSPTLFTLWLELEKFVGIDLSAPISAFENLIAKHPCGKRIRTYYNTSQTDKTSIERIIGDEFGATPIDLIIDDASHRYSETKKSFEIAFPLLRSGGSYVIEDWGWAHWKGFNSLPGQTAMSKLIMELVMLCASRNDIVSEVRIFPGFVVVKKSIDAPKLVGMKLESLINKQGIELVGTGDLNLAGVARLMTSRVRNIIRRR